MPQDASHYHTLKVPQNAPVETIRASYKHLARQCHPDRNANSSESHRLMQSLNAAFEILSDPVRRSAYDAALQESESAAVKAPSIVEKTRTWMSSRRQNIGHLVDRFEPARKITATRWVARGAFVLLALWALNLDREPNLHADTPPSSPNRDEVRLPPTAPPYHRSQRAPNGVPWPTGAGEIERYPRDHNDGKSVVTIDNSLNAADVFVKLISMDEPTMTVRHIYIPGGGSFECKNLRKGVYEVRYQELSSGLAARSGKFEVLEMRTDTTVSFSVMKITLVEITETKPQGLRISTSHF